jgi:hypothetical protein
MVRRSAILFLFYLAAIGADAQSMYPAKESLPVDHLRIDEATLFRPAAIDRVIYAYPAPSELSHISIQSLPVSVENITKLNTPDPLRVAVVGGIIGGAGYAVNEMMRNAWWSDQRGPFHYQEALVYARNIDKLGHVYAGYLNSFIFYRLTNWTGINEERALWYGASLGLLFQLYIEAQDGFSTRWGFERYDAIGDLGGAALFVARYYFEPLRYFQMKFGYYPSDRLVTRGAGDQRRAVESWIDDYEGHTYWIAFRAGKFVNEHFHAPRWLRFVNIAGGWSLGDYRDYTEFYLALDLNFEELPGSSWFLRRLWEGLDLIKFPSPAIRIRPGMVMYGLYF